METDVRLSFKFNYFGVSCAQCTYMRVLFESRYEWKWKYSVKTIIISTVLNNNIKNIIMIMNNRCEIIDIM